VIDKQDDEAPETAPETEEAEDAGALGEAGGEEIDALEEFESYDSLDEEQVGDAQLEALAGADGDGQDGEALETPKARRLAGMRLEARIEAIVFASQKPMKPQEILDLLADPLLTVGDVQTCLDILTEFYEDRHGGFRLHYLKRLGYQFQTADAAGPIMERMFASRPRPISRAALETLAIIAYRQPVTRAEVEFIRGVDAGSIFKTLLERDLVKCVGRKEIVGRPMLFGTTDDFLKVFNLSSVKDLPPLEAFQPARDMVQGAMEKLEDPNALIDVEEYIADNTGGEYEALEPDADETSRALEGATVQDALREEPEVNDGTGTDSEVAFSAGPGEPEGGGDLDR
jgi:segregation and condensation protein B